MTAAMDGVLDAMQLDPEEMRDAARRLLADKVDRRAPWQAATESASPLS